MSSHPDAFRPRSVAGVQDDGSRAIVAEVEPSAREKRAMLHLSNVSHAVNHFQNQMMTMLYPYIMADLGMSYTAVGVMSAISSVLNSFCQGAYGFLTPFFSRCKLLGFGNLGIALGLKIAVEFFERHHFQQREVSYLHARDVEPC